jgi:hypothetical protein
LLLLAEFSWNIVFPRHTWPQRLLLLQLPPLLLLLLPPLLLLLPPLLLLLLLLWLAKPGIAAQNSSCCWGELLL